MSSTIYKILTRTESKQANSAGIFIGSGVDLADGYIHFSTATQVRETAAKHFSEQEDLMLLSVDAGRLPPESLRWEPSRGGQLFPHLYEPLVTGWVLDAAPLLLENGVYVFSDKIP